MQTLPASQLQTVLVDDGSTSSASLRALDQLATWREFRLGMWRLLRLPSRYLGAARNAAAREADGVYLFFLDDDNYLKVRTRGSSPPFASHVLNSSPYCPTSDTRWRP